MSVASNGGFTKDHGRGVTAVIRWPLAESYPAREFVAVNVNANPCQNA